jgi:ABC-type multidrug transport system permease subunit
MSKKRIEKGEMFEEVIDWVTLVFLEIFTSFMALGLILAGILLIAVSWWGLGIFLILLGIVFIGLFINAIKLYLEIRR